MKLFATTVLAIFLLWGAVHFLNANHHTLKRAPSFSETAAARAYTDADRKRDAARRSGSSAR